MLINVFRNQRSKATPATWNLFIVGRLILNSTRRFIRRVASRSVFIDSPAAASISERSLLCLVQRIFLVSAASPISFGSPSHQDSPWTVILSAGNRLAEMMCSREILSEQSPRQAAQHSFMGVGAAQEREGLYYIAVPIVMCLIYSTPKSHAP